VLPGVIDTPKTLALPDAVREGMAADTALGRIGDPDEIAATVEFLLSPAAGYITGEALRVDGGAGLRTTTITGR
jgi:3-oxoacyl-[acyl-carrier protein] reductase